MLKRTSLFIVLIAFLGLVNQGCSYTLTGASTVGLKTINVQFFENNAPLVVNNLSQIFTESLKDRIRSQTSLNIVRGDADAVFSGNIIGYAIAPVAVQATNTNTAPPIASASRLTITVNVKYVTNNNKEQKKNEFEQQFSRYADFTGDISSQEQGLIAQINKQLTEDIFNKAFANW